MTGLARHLLMAPACGAILAAAAAVLLFAANHDNPRLPGPVTEGSRSLEEALSARRSVRSFTDEALSEAEIAQLCWAAQGVTETRRGFRTAPSAGATYPLELYVATAEGVSRYVPDEHRLVEHLSGDLRPRLREACLGQRWVEEAAAVFIIAADVQRTARRYGQRAERYVYIEVGHAAQNLLLQAVALDLGGVPVGAFDEDRMARIMQLPAGQRTIYLLPLGRMTP